MKTLTHSLGDKLKSVHTEENEHRNKKNPRSGIDFPDNVHSPTRLSGTVLTAIETQKAHESRHKKNEEVGTASQNNQNQNIRTETTTMQTTNTETNTETSSVPNNVESQKISVEQAAVSIANNLASSTKKIADEGIVLRPAFKRRRADGYAVAGAAIGVAGGAIVGTLTMSKFGSAPTNQDITNAGYAAAIVGGVVGGCTGNFIGGWVDEKESAKSKK